MTEETRPDQDTPALTGAAALTEQTAEAGHTGPLPPLPDSAYGDDAEPIPPHDDLPDDEAALEDTDPNGDNPYGDGAAQEVQP